MPDAQWHPQPRDTHHSQRGARMSEARCGTSETPDLAEPVIGGALSRRRVGSSGLRQP